MPRPPRPPERPAHRPRRDPAAARQVKSFRLHPEAIRRIEAEAERKAESQSQVVERLARRLPLPPS